MEPTKISPPRRAALWREARAGLDLARLAAGWRRLRDGPRGDGEPVLLIPGYGADDWALGLLRRHLNGLGYAAGGWGLGRNEGDPEAVLPQVIDRVRELVGETVHPVKLVGWSLGGVIAREVARARPDLVDRVVTLGTPVVGGPKYTILADTYRRRGVDLEQLERRIESRGRTPIRVPVTAVVATGDAIVSPAACVDRTEDVETVEIATSHFGLLCSPEVFAVVAAALAEQRARSATRLAV